MTTEVATLIAAVIGALVSFVNLWMARRATFVNTLTNERFKELAELNKLIGLFWTDVYMMTSGQLSGRDEHNQAVRRIEETRMLLRLKLSQQEIADAELIGLLSMDALHIQFSAQGDKKQFEDALVAAVERVVAKRWIDLKAEIDPLNIGE